MNARSLELFKALTEATFWFYTHPKDTSYRLIYNKSRYTMDKVRIMKMLRLYMPFVRRLDDQALVTYMYRNGGVVVAQMQSGQLGNLQTISDLIPDTLQSVSEADLAAQQKAIDEALAREQEEQRVKEEESKKKNQDISSSGTKRVIADKTQPTSDKTRLEDLAKRAEKSGLVITNSGGVVIEPINKPIDLNPSVEIPTLVIANKSGVIVGPVKGKTGLVIPSRPSLSPPSVGPSRWERMLGGTMRASTGAPIVNAGRNITSQAGIFVKRQGVDRIGKVFSGWINRGGNQAVQNRYEYAVDEEFDEYTTYSRSGDDEEKKKGWAMLGLGLGWWLAILLILVLIFSTLSGSEEEEKSGDSGGGGVENGDVSGGADYSVCKFTRAGSSKNIGSTILAGWIRDAADKEGISPAVLASVAMHENPNFTGEANNDHDGITSGKMCGVSKTFCTYKGQVKHTKAYDRIPADDPCTPEEIANGAETAQAVGLMQFLDIYNKGKDLCDIKTSLALAAAKLKGTGLSTNPSQDEITKAIENYHVSCFYGEYNYCTEVYQDLQNCKPKAADTACLAGWPTSGTITQGPKGTFSHLEIYNRNGDSRSAVDIAGPIGTPVLATFPGEISYICTGECKGGGNTVYLKVDKSVAKNDSVVVRFLHLSVIDKSIAVGTKISPGNPIGLMGNTGGSAERPYGSHLHYDFQNLTLAKPNIPTNIVPDSCDTPNIACTPTQVTVCNAALVTVEKAEGGEYWFLMNRIGKYEILYRGEPGVISKSKVVKVSRINPGSPGKEPTPLPQKVGGQKYWLTTAGLITYRPKNTDAYDKFGPYFIPLNVPTSYRDPICANQAKKPRKGEEVGIITEDCYGPKYEECGPSGGEQCNWLTAGQFAIHGNNRLDEEGSAGCVRHMNDDISEIYNLLKAENKLVGTRYYVIDDQAAPSVLNDQILERALR